jgi:hypothetical protein
MSDTIEIRLTGEGIRPGLIRSHEIAEILAAVEDLVVAETIKRDPSAKKEDIIVGLYEIADESIGLRFKSSLASIAVPAFIGASQALAAGDFAELSPHSYGPLQVISTFAKRHHGAAEFKVDGVKQPLATIDEATALPQVVRIRGSTELTARIQRVGGKVPRAALEMLDGALIYCDVTQSLAMELGPELYKLATFTGNAVWNATTLELEEFTVTGFERVPEQQPYEALSQVEPTLLDAYRGNWTVLDRHLYMHRRGEDQE